MWSQNLTTRKLTITLGSQLVEQIDQLAAQDFTSRTAIIRLALLEYIRKTSSAPAAIPATTNDVGLEKTLEEFQRTMGG